jgi:hypothetical protein
MTFDPRAKQFHISCRWSGRREEPQSIAERLRNFIDGVAKIDDTLAPWMIGRQRRVPYQSAKHDLPALIHRDVIRSEDGEVEVISGYTILGSTTDDRQRYMIVGSAGATYEPCNGLLIQTCSHHPVDPSIVTYSVMKALMLATIASWTPTFCLAGSSEFVPSADGERVVVYPWLFYVTAADAASVDLVGIPFSERMPDGGHLLSATTQVFDADNPAHIEAARRISQATQYLDGALTGH